MNAMILAAGRGDRLRPLTDHIPKPLVDVQGQPVIAHTLARLARLGVVHVCINACYLAEKLIAYVGDGSAWGVQVTWSREAQCLDTGGGVVQALRYVGEAPFLVVNGDILWDMDLRPLLAAFNAQTMDGLLAVVKNPEDGSGDFFYSTQSQEKMASAAPVGRLRRVAGCVVAEGQKMVTYSGIQILQPLAFKHYSAEPFSLNRFYDTALQGGRLRGLLLHGHWADMGTPERLEKARKIEWTSGHF